MLIKLKLKHWHVIKNLHIMKRTPNANIIHIICVCFGETNFRERLYNYSRAFFLKKSLPKEITEKKFNIQYY